MLEKFSRPFPGCVASIVNRRLQLLTSPICVCKLMLDVASLPEGALQLIPAMVVCDLCVCTRRAGLWFSFTGSAKTRLMLRRRPHLLENSVHFVGRAGTAWNASVLGPDAAPGTAEFRSVHQRGPREIGPPKGGSEMHGHPPDYCAADHCGGVIASLSRTACETTSSDSARQGHRMGPLREPQPARTMCWRESCAAGHAATRIYGDPDEFSPVHGCRPHQGAFVATDVVPLRGPRQCHPCACSKAFWPRSTVHAPPATRRTDPLLKPWAIRLSVVASVDHPRTAIWRARWSWCRRLARAVSILTTLFQWAESTATARRCRHMVHGGPGRAGRRRRGWGGIRGL